MTETGESLASFGLCLAARKAVVDKQMGADPTLPGPGQYVNPLTEGRNANGEVKATLSSQKSVRSVCFGQEGVKGMGRPVERPVSAPGPKYNVVKPSIGPSATFGAGQRSQVRGKDNPSPQHYDVKNLDTVPGTKFRTGPRTYNDVKGDETPGPGQYHPRSAIGAQVESRYSSGRAFSIHGRQKHQGKPKDEPGPGHYIDPVKEGRNGRGEAKVVLSHQRSYPSAVFSKGTRSSTTRTARPQSASAYTLPSCLGRQANSRYKSAAAPSFGAR